MRTKILIATLIIMFATSLGLIIALSVNKSSGGVVLSDQISEIRIYNSSQTVTKTITPTDDDFEIFNEIVNLYNKSFTGSFYEQVKEGDYYVTKVEENIEAEEWNEYNKQNGLYLEFVYKTPARYIIYRDGNSRVVNISSIIMLVSGSKKIEPINIYYSIDDKYINDSSKTGDSEIYYPLGVNGKTKKLYSYLKSIV